MSKQIKDMDSKIVVRLQGVEVGNISEDGCVELIMPGRWLSREERQLMESFFFVDCYSPTLNAGGYKTHLRLFFILSPSSTHMAPPPLLNAGRDGRRVYRQTRKEKNFLFLHQ